MPKVLFQSESGDLISGPTPVVIEPLPVAGNEIEVKGVIHVVTDAPARFIPYTSPIGESFSVRVTLRPVESTKAVVGGQTVKSAGKPSAIAKPEIVRG